MDMKFKAPMAKRWELKDDRVIVGKKEYYFCEIKTVTHDIPKEGSVGWIGIEVEGGWLGSGKEYLNYKYKDIENAKLAARYLSDKVKNIEYNPNLSKNKKKKSKNNYFLFIIISIILSAIIGFNLSYGTSMYRAIILFVGGFLGLIFSFLFSVLIDKIPQKIGTVFKPLLMIIIIGALCVGVVFTYGIGGNPSSGSHNSSVCKLCKDKQTTNGDYCLECYISLKQIADAYEE